MTQSVKAEQFRALHRGPAPLVLPNVWDAASVCRVTRRLPAHFFVRVILRGITKRPWLERTAFPLIGMLTN
jgi:hypothetical protein